MAGLLGKVNRIGEGEKEEDNWRSVVVMGISYGPCGYVARGWKSVMGGDEWSEIGATDSSI